MSAAASTQHERDPATIPVAWWVTALVGSVSLVVGVIILFRPDDSLATLAVLSGIFLLVDGCYELVTSLGAHRDSRAGGVALGLLGIVAGVILIRHPVTSIEAIGLLLGLWLVAAGAVRLAVTVAYDRHWVPALLGVLQVGVGIAIVASPHLKFATLALLAGASFIIRGLILILAAWVMRAIAGGDEAATAADARPGAPEGMR